MVVTFYSFKGGVGRSMALVNVAEILADSGYSVIVCDWDLEAPGLEHYICNSAEEAMNWRRNPGIIDLIQEYKATIARPTMKSDTSEGSPGADEDFTIVGKIRLRRPSSYARSIGHCNRRSNGSIRFLNAGRRDDKWEAIYNQTVRDANWSEFYEKWAGGAYFEFLRRDLEEQAKIILIDSRTGVTELGGVCTHHIPDLVFLFTAANEQNMKGTEWMTKVLEYPGVREQHQQRGFIFIPIAARIDSLSELKMSTEFLNDFKSRFSKYVPQSLGDAQRFLEESMVPYAAGFSFKETIVARFPPDKRHPVILKPYQILADAVVRIGKATCQLREDDPGPVPLTLESRISTSNDTAAPRTATLVPQGEFYFAWSEIDRARAGKLVDALLSAELQVWSGLGQSEIGPAEPFAPQVQKAIARSVGYLILLPQGPFNAWTEAQINLALNRQALHERYRVLLLAQEPAPTLPSELKRFPIFVLPPFEGTDVVGRILAELLPAQNLSTEPAAATVLEAVQMPTEHDSRFFFGRQAEIDDLITFVETALQAPRPWLILSGAVGSGKTRLIRAGLIPAFQRGIFGKKRTSWHIAIISGHADRWDAQFRSALAKAVGVAVENWSELLSSIEQLREPILIFVDDIDARPRSTDGKISELTQIIDRLNAIQQECCEGFFAIFAVRGNQLEAFRGLAGPSIPPEAYRQIAPLSAGGVREYLVGASRLLGVSFEPGLVDLIVREAPRVATIRTLGAVLQRLYQEKNPSGMLTHQCYQSFGGIEGFIVREAAQTLAKLDQQTEGGPRRIVTGLINVRTGALVEQSRSDLLAPIQLKTSFSLFNLALRPSRLICALPDPNPVTDEVLSVLVDTNIAMVSGDGSHEASVRLTSTKIANIPLVQEWLEAESNELRLSADLEDLAQRWIAAGRPDTLLPGGRVLRELARAKTSSDAAFKFLKAAAVEDSRTFRERVLLSLLIYGALMFLVGAPAFLYFENMRAAAFRREREAILNNYKAIEERNAQAQVLILQQQRILDLLKERQPLELQQRSGTSGSSKPSPH